MPGDDGSGTSKDFNECVTQDQLREAIEQGKKEMKEVVAVTEPPTSEPQNSLFLSFFLIFWDQLQTAKRFYHMCKISSPFCQTRGNRTAYRPEIF